MRDSGEEEWTMRLFFLFAKPYNTGLAAIAGLLIVGASCVYKGGGATYRASPIQIEESVSHNDLEDKLFEDPSTVVRFNEDELRIWKRVYMEDNVLGSHELEKMVSYFFKNYAEKFTNFGPNYVPLNREFEVESVGNYEAIIKHDGKEYTFCLDENFDSAEMYLN